jgi:hypothetical protein
MLKLHLNRVDLAHPNTSSTEFAKADLAPVSPGMWHHWRADIRWSPTDGSVKVWHDDVVKYDSTNLKVQTIFPDPDSTGQPGDSYLKVGLYRKPVNGPGLA